MRERCVAPAEIPSRVYHNIPVIRGNGPRTTLEIKRKNRDKLHVYIHIFIHDKPACLQPKLDLVHTMRLETRQMKLNFEGLRWKPNCHRKAPIRHHRGLLPVLMLAGYLGITPPVEAASTQPGQPLVLGIQNGRVQQDAVSVFNTAKLLADFIGTAAGHKVIWETNFTKANADQSDEGGAHVDFVFSKPPNLTAMLLSKGWKLVVVAKSQVEFGTDLIAQACPGKPGQVLLGGPTLAILGASEASAHSVCVPMADVWKSSAAILLTASKGSLVDTTAQKMWREHSGGKIPPIVYTQYQNAVTSFMTSTHAAVIGSVTPIFSQQWKAKGGVIMAHQAMPFWAVLAAPGTAEDTVDKIRAAFLNGSPQAIDKALHIPGWEAGNPKPYAEFMQWLKAKA